MFQNKFNLIKNQKKISLQMHFGKTQFLYILLNILFTLDKKITFNFSAFMSQLSDSLYSLN